MVWDPAEWYNLDRVTFLPGALWLPDFRIDNR